MGGVVLRQEPAMQLRLALNSWFSCPSLPRSQIGHHQILLLILKFILGCFCLFCFCVSCDKAVNWETVFFIWVGTLSQLKLLTTTKELNHSVWSAMVTPGRCKSWDCWLWSMVKPTILMLWLSRLYHACVEEKNELEVSQLYTPWTAKPVTKLAVSIEIITQKI